MSAVMPFLLLILVTLRLPLADPSPLFGIAALLTLLAFVTVRFHGFPILLPMTLAGTWFLELLWNDQRFDPARPVIPLLWYLAFPAVHFIFPFLFRDRFGKQTIPWATSALAFPAHFLLIYPLVKGAWPNNYMGLLPALFAVPAIIALIALVKHLPLDAPKRNTQLALFGGVALLFITLIFPIQFSKQWLTIAWALEGVALLWLFHRVPHMGLKWVGTVLLGVAFARLALNPEVFDYQPRSGQLILNWWLYSYGIVTASLFAAAWLALPPRDQLHGLRLPPLFQTLGTILAFLLLNIEIADAFSDGPRLQFRFSRNLAQDMTYSIGWGVFAFVLLIVGILRDRAAARYAGLALLVVTLVKLFLHDLWQLGGLFRIGSLIGLAVVLMVVSFIYQKFLSGKPVRKEVSQ
jgi:uncharacterized membrane protein